MRCTQPCVSSTVPRWMPTSCSRRRAGQLAGAAAADGELAIAPGDLAHRRDHRSGAAGEGFDQLAALRVVAPLVDANSVSSRTSSPSSRASVMIDIAGDAGQDRAGQRRA